MVNSSNEIIVQRRKELGLSQLYISDVLGYSVQTISKWETGKSFPSLLSWGALAKVLQIDLDALINGELKSKYNGFCLNNTFSAEKFAKNLRKQRKIRDLTQTQLANQLSISYQTLLAWEKGNAFPNVEQFKKLSEVMNISYDELYFGENDLVAYQEDDKSNEVKKENKIAKKLKSFLESINKPKIVQNTKKYGVILGLILILIFSVSAATLTLLSNRDSGNNYDSTNFENDYNSTNSENEYDFIDEIVNKPFKDNGVLSRYFYDDIRMENRELAIYKRGDNYYKSVGCDYRFESDANISAAFSGKVLETGTDEYYGNYVWIEHDSGAKSFYASLDNIVVNINDEIESGYVIATSGASSHTAQFGQETLHFELKIKDEHTDPEKAYGKSIKDLMLEKQSKKG